MGQDYTVYAYDYSEYETPLVGQGMLSWILASSSSTPMAPAHQSHTMVTGRVCKNVLGLFSGGSHEALEVKLRLVPVPTALQSEYLASLEKYRSAGNLPAGSLEQNSDAAAWSSALQTSPTCPPHSASGQPQPSYPHHTTANENFRRASTSRFANESSHFDPSHNSLFSDGPGSAPNVSAGQHQSRPTTPSQQPPPAQTKKRTNPPSRPSSRNSNRGRPSLKHATTCASRVETVETSENEDGPRRKRARVTQTDWNGSSNFGSNTESLRVTAATAASIRGQRPTANNSVTSDLIAGEVGERPPTPRPRQLAAPKPIPTLPRSLTTPAYELQQPQPARERPAKNDPLGILNSSPEKGDNSSNGSSPMDLPSSPPVVRDTSPTSSSPSLPKLPHFQDSGFASGNLDEFLPEGNDGYDADDFDFLAPTDVPEASAPDHSEEPQGDPSTIGRKLLPGPAPPEVDNKAAESSIGAAPSSPGPVKRKRPAKPRSQSVSKAAARSKSTSQPSEDDGAGGNDASHPNIALLAAALPTGDPRFRSESLLSDVSQADGTSIRAPFKPVEHSKKKQAIQDKLAESIKNGQMPRFCKNCGEIETPVWRKAFMKVEQGEPKHIEISDSDNGIMTWEALDKSEDGTVLSYRILKKSIKQEELGFEEIELCNRKSRSESLMVLMLTLWPACGIWLFKNKAMRPHEAWNRQAGPLRKKSQSKKKSASKQTQRPANAHTSDARVASSGPAEDQPLQSTETAVVAPRRPQIQRASSVGPMMQVARKKPSNARDKAALQRAIQSSPPRFPGSRVSPIEIDLDADQSQPTKRLLFPSPRKAGEVKSLDPAEDKQVSPIKRSKRWHSGDVEGDKENQAPVFDGDDDGFDHLFGENTRFLTTAKQGSQGSNTNKTPSRSVKRTPLSSKSQTPGHHRRHSNPETPSRNANPNLAAQQVTPFSTKLSRLLSESNDGREGPMSFSPLGSHGLDEPGMFAFSDLSNGDTNGKFSLYDDNLGPDRNIWEGGNLFDESFDAFLEQSYDSTGQVATTPDQPET